MATEWFYYKGDERIGPVDPSQVKNLASTGKLLPTDLIWKEGMDQPVPANKLKGLFGASPPMAPAVPVSRAIPVAVAAPPASKSVDDRKDAPPKARTRDSDEEEDIEDEVPERPKGMSKKKRNILIGVIGGSVFLAFATCCGLAGIIGVQHTKKTDTEEVEVNKPSKSESGPRVSKSEYDLGYEEGVQLGRGHVDQYKKIYDKKLAVESFEKTLKTYKDMYATFSKQYDTVKSKQPNDKEQLTNLQTRKERAKGTIDGMKTTAQDAGIALR